MSEVLYCPECKKESAGGYIICEECYEQLLIKLAAEQKDRKFPLLQQGANIGSVPWWVAEQAYMGYASKYGDQQSLERLAERGGFGIDEMDEYFPDWRDKCSIITKLQAELDTANEARQMAETGETVQSGIRERAQFALQKMAPKLAKTEKALKRMNEQWCNRVDRVGVLRAELAAEQAENKRLRDALEMARQLMEWAESKCHLNCADGYVPMMPDGDPEPCQWCVTKKAAEQALKEKP